MKSAAQQLSHPFSHSFTRTQFGLHRPNLRRFGGLLGLLAMAGLLPVLIALVANISGLAGNPATGFPLSKFDVIDFAENPNVGVQEARALIASGALVLDARSAQARASDPLPNAQPIDSLDLGLGDDVLNAALRALGVSAAQAIVVVGDPTDSSAEEDHIVAALRALGHPRAVLAVGGLPALRAAGFLTIYPPMGAGDFTVARQDS